MKYIVYWESEREFLVTFPDEIRHDRMSEAMEDLRFGGDYDGHRRQGEIVAAGFVVDGKCHGSSQTLGVASRGDVDTKLLQSQ